MKDFRNLRLWKKSNLTMCVPLIKILMLFLHSSDHFSTQNSLSVPVWIKKYLHINKKHFNVHVQ